MADQILIMTLKAVDHATGVFSKVGNGVKALNDKVKGISLGAGIAATAIGGLGIIMVNTAGKFEKFQSVLQNSLGSAVKASQAMDMLRDISTKTPFALDEITASYIKLVNRGFKPTENEIIRLGDLAASQGKSFDMLTEAILDAQTGEMERLKEFGVTAQQNGDKVSFTFKGVTTTVQKSDKAIRDYILSLGALQGVQGSMQVQSETFEGKVSNLGDAWTNLSATIGQKFLPIAKETIQNVTNILNTLNKRIGGTTEASKQHDYLSGEITKTDAKINDLDQSLSNGEVTMAEYQSQTAKLNAEKKALQAQLDVTTSSTDLFQEALDNVNKTKIIGNYDVYVTERKQIQATIDSLMLLNAARAAAFNAQVDAEKSLAEINKKSQANIGTGKSGIAGQGSLADFGQFEFAKAGGFQSTVTLMDQQVTSTTKGLSKSLEEYQKKFGDAEKQLQDLSNNVNTKGGGSKGSDKAKENAEQIKQEKELLALAGDRMKAVEKMNISETRKAQLIIGINEDTSEQLKKIRGDDLKDQEGYYQKAADTAQKKLDRVKDSFKGMYDAVKTSISKSKDEVQKLTDKIQDSLDKIKGFRDDLANVGKDRQTSLTDRFIEINKELADTQKKSWSFDNVGQANEFQDHLSALQKERDLILQTVGKEATDKATQFDQLSPAEKIMQLAKEKEDEIGVKIAAEEKLMKEMEVKREEERIRLVNFNQAKIKIERDYTQLFKDELQEREAAFAGFISNLEALQATSKVKVNGIVGTEIAGQRALGGTISPGKNYLVGENGPEVISSSSTARVDNLSGGRGSQNNYFTINISKEVDGDKFIDKMKKELNMDAKLYRNGIKR